MYFGSQVEGSVMAALGFVDGPVDQIIIVAYSQKLQETPHCSTLWRSHLIDHQHCNGSIGNKEGDPIRGRIGGKGIRSMSLD